MSGLDVERARAAHSALKEFFSSRPKGRLRGDEVRSVAQLCHEAASAISDVECRIAIRKIAGYSEMLSGTEETRGADFVRLRVQNALATFRSHLKDLQGARR